MWSSFMQRSRFRRDLDAMVGAVLCIAATSASAFAQETTRVSVDSAGVEGDRNCNPYDAPVLSADGRFIAFTSSADNLVANDTNRVDDIFVHDRVTGITERISVDSLGAEANDFNLMPSISADGQLVAFVSNASNLVAGDGNSTFDVFVHDRATGATERISVDSSGGDADDESLYPVLSPDGSLVVFSSYASNLIAGDTNQRSDVFVRDRVNGTTERVSVDSSGAEANGDSATYSPPTISADGSVIAFESLATDLVAGDTNGTFDVFVHDRATGLTERVSVRTSGTQGNGWSYWPSLSADGQIVSFWSAASNLVAHDTNLAADVFVHDRSAGTTERVSVDSSGVQSNADSYFPSLSPDGRLIAFGSYAADLVSNDTNGAVDAFVHDRSTGVTERVSVDSTGAQANGHSANLSAPTLSADGQVVAFCSEATNLVANDTNGAVEVFVHEFCSTAASWSNYGAGFPGTNGIPAFTSQQNPAFGATVTLDLSNSYANPTVGVIFVGFQRTSIHSGWGGDLLVVPALSMFVTFSYGGDSFTGTIPDDRSLCGVTVDLQAIEADPGAAKGVSFTQGLELVLGH
jgi:Tol biopolymer transport system component